MKRERIEEIAELLDKRGKLTLEQLEEYFPNVSQMTLRRDLFQLEEEGKIIRVRGGAMSVKEVQKASGEPYTKKATIHTDEKIEIAQKAAVLVDEGSSIFIDGGTTALYLAKELRDMNCNVFTNGIAVAKELAQKKKRHHQPFRRTAHQRKPVHGLPARGAIFHGYEFRARDHLRFGVYARKRIFLRLANRGRPFEAGAKKSEVPVYDVR